MIQQPTGIQRLTAMSWQPESGTCYLEIFHTEIQENGMTIYKPSAFI